MCRGWSPSDLHSRSPSLSCFSQHLWFSHSVWQITSVPVAPRTVISFSLPRRQGLKPWSPECPAKRLLLSGRHDQGEVRLIALSFSLRLGCYPLLSVFYPCSMASFKLLPLAAFPDNHIQLWCDWLHPLSTLTYMGMENHSDRLEFLLCVMPFYVYLLFRSLSLYTH